MERLQLVQGRRQKPHPDQHRSARRHRPGARSRLPRRLSRSSRAQHADGEALPGTGLGGVFDLAAVRADRVHCRRHGEDKAKFERETLYPLAGLDPASAPAYDALTDALRELRGVEYTVADAYLGGRIDRATAIAQLQRYQLAAPERAAKRIDFIDAYRSYIINYGLGEDLASARLSRAGGPDAQWTLLQTLLSEPTLPRDLEAR